MIRLIGCITEEHDLRLVALAACICVLACNTTINLLARAQAVPNKKTWAWLVAAATLFGSGVWSLHFVAMLAFTPATGLGYGTTATMISAGVAVIGAMLGFAIWRFSHNRIVSNGAGGVAVGLSIVAMHYSGVAAIQLPGTMSFDRSMVVASILVAIGFAVIGLARTRVMSSFWRRTEVSIWFTLSICGMHFSGMSALTLKMGVLESNPGPMLASGSLAIAVGSVAIAILVVSMAGILMEQHLSERAVLELARIRTLSDIAREALIVCRDDMVLQVNAACGRLFGTPAEGLVGQCTRDLFVDADRPKIIDIANRKTVESAVREVLVKTVSGGVLPVELSQGEILYEGKPATVMALRDLSDQKRDEERIRHLAHHDALTDLPNRFLLQERFEHDAGMASRSGKRLALLYLDLDRFKPVNDALGHTAGDELLVQVAGRLRGTLRSTDTLARIGGDEFVILATVDQPADASMIATQVIHVLSQPFTLHDNGVEIGTSVGIALYPEDGIDQDALMRSADTALYRAKREKRGTFRFFEIGMHEHLQERQRLEQDLRKALERGQMALHYQPLVACTTGELTGFEALIRWQHPRRGMIPPTEFIPLAEDSGLIVQLGHWVLETACRTAAAWNESWRVAVNVSPVQFRQPDFYEEVASILTQTGLTPSMLEIEITEGVLMDGTVGTKATLTALRDLGVRIVLDDFGTGYSSLSYLHSFRFDKLKIDRSFVQRLEEQGDATTIVRAIVGLARGLGLEIVAEGVETSGQLAAVQDYFCDQVQGYLLGRPMRMDEPTELMAMRAKALMAAHARSESAPLERDQAEPMPGLAS